MAGSSQEKGRNTSPRINEFEIRRGNTDFSIGPGMTVFVTPEKREVISGVYQRNGYDPLEVTSVTEGIEAIMYYDGVYGMGFGGIELWQHATPTDEDGTGWTSRRNVLSGPYDLVIRIEGARGEVWQNFDFIKQGKVIEGLTKLPPQGNKAK